MRGQGGHKQSGEPHAPRATARIAPTIRRGSSPGLSIGRTGGHLALGHITFYIASVFRQQNPQGCSARGRENGVNYTKRAILQVMKEALYAESSRFTF